MKIYSKTPQLLYSYLATEMLAPFFASFIIMNCVFFLVKLIPFLNFVLDLNIGFADFVRLFSYLFPNIFLYSLPMAAMMGVTIGFARLSSDSEILAFKASGISIYQILPPVIIVASLIALLTSYFSIKLIPLSEVSMKQLTYQLLKEKINEGVKEHVFTEALGEVVVYIDKIDKETGEWQNVWVSDTRGVTNPVITMASTGSMVSNISSMMVSIMLRNGSLHRPSNESAQIVEFEQYQINIPLKPPTGKATTLKKTALSMKELQEEARIAVVAENHRKYLIEYHKRLVLPVGCLIISLIGLPLGLQARPGRKAIGIQLGLAIFVLYYIFFTVGKTLAEEGALPVPLAMWAPNTIFLVLAIFWIVRIAGEKPLIPDKLSQFIKKFWDKITTPITAFWKSLLSRRKKMTGDSIVNSDIGADLVIDENVIKGNAKSRVFHLPVCEFYNCKNCTLTFKNVEIAIDAGFEPCRFCKDIIEDHPEESASENQPSNLTDEKE
ncbi:MAG: LPS export ABC transporter permease LptF [Desulforhopalus sp.]|nr:LPS export ABC transporter permease LptF [Desulforhopalus sp.]